jgi:hypothetical protein
MRSTLFKTNTLSLIFFSARSLKQQSMDIHVTPLGHIILIPSQPVFALYTNFLVFDLTRSMLEHTISSTRGEHSYRCSNTRSTALEESTLTSLVQSGPHHHLIPSSQLTCSRHDIAEQLALNNNHSLSKFLLHLFLVR